MRVPNRPAGLNILIGAIVVVLVAAVLEGRGTAGAQTASPAATPGTMTCDVEPRSDEELEQLAQTPATPSSEAGEGSIDDQAWDEGVATDEGTVSEITIVIVQIDACSLAGDLFRLLALYSDDYIVREFLATEPVPIVPGTPEATAATGTPEPADTLTTVHEVRTLSDGRVAALVERDGRTEIRVFVEMDDRWLLDAVAPAPEDGATPESEVPGELASLPPVQAAVADAAGSAGIPVSDVVVTSVEPTVWPDSSLGCPQPDQFYAQVETPGYIVTLDVAGTEVTYHTDEGEAAVPCEAGGS